MRPEDRTHLLLAAYLDGELSPGETLEMEERLEADAELRRLRDDLSGLSRSVHDLVSRTEVPAGLADGIVGRLAALEPLPARRADPPSNSPATPPWRALAASLAIGLLAGGALGYGFSRLSGQGGAIPVEEAVFANHLRGLAAPQPFDIASSDRHVVKPWFNGRTAIAPDAPDLSAQGFPLVGGRVDIVDGQTVPTLVYRRRQHVISVTALPREEGAAAGPLRHEGSRIERWNAGDLTYLATSDLNAKELGEFAALFRSATAPVD